MRPSNIRALRLTIYILIAALIVLFMVSQVFGVRIFPNLSPFNMNIFGQGANYKNTVLIPAPAPGGFKDVKLGASACRIDIVPADGQNVSIDEAFHSKDSMSVSYSADGASLTIDIKPPGGFHLFNFGGSNKVTLRLPKNSYDSIDIGASACDANAEIPRAASLGITVEAGNLKLSGEFDDVRAEVSAGKAELTCGVLPKSFTADVSAGEMNINLPENDGFAVYADVSAGAFNSGFSDFTPPLKSSQGGLYSYKNARTPLYNFSVSAGSINLNKQ